MDIEQIKTIVEPKSKALPKKKHFFETYITKILKLSEEKNSITLNAKQQLNSAICIMIRIISKTARELTETSKKKTLSEKEIYNAIKMIFSGELAKNAVYEGEKAIEQIQKKETRLVIFPASIISKFLRNFGYSKLMVSHLAPICLAAAMEYITTEILELASDCAKENKHVRITVRDLELCVRKDPELDKLFTRGKISFLGGGNIPFIHDSLLPKNKKKSTTETGDVKKKHRFRPGTVAIREIKKNQKLNKSLTIPRTSFERIVRQFVSDNQTEQPNHCDIMFRSSDAAVMKRNENLNIEPMKISKEVFIILQYFIEQYAINILNKANFAAIHAGRIKLTPIDIQFVSFLCEGQNNPYHNTNTQNNIDEILFIEDETNVIDEIETEII
jgi:histone H3/H4